MAIKEKLLGLSVHPFLQAGGLAAALFLVTLALAAQQSLAQIRVAGMPVAAHATQAQLAQTLRQHARSYELTVQKADKTAAHFTLADAGVSIDYQASAKQAITAKRAGNWWHHLAWWQQRNLPLTLKVDQSALRRFVAAQSSDGSTAPQDARLVIKDGQAEIVPQHDGTGLTLKGSAAGVLRTARYLSPAPLLQQSSIARPAITTSDLMTSRHQVQTMLEQKYILSLPDKTITVAPDDVGGWLSLTPDDKHKTVDVDVNSAAVKSYLDSLTQAYAAQGLSQVVLDNNGSETTLLPGQTGTAIDDGTAAAQLAGSLRADQGATISLSESVAPPQTVHVPVTNKFIVVDVTRKQLYAFEGTSMVQTFPVSAGAAATPTVTGTYHIYQKFDVQDMRGANADGTNYFQPKVPWVNYFYQDYAIHGNYWRPASYFGHINSSHGCVGLLDDQAQWIYNWAPVGTQVTVLK